MNSNPGMLFREQLVSDRRHLTRIASLGPAGTSSETAIRVLATWLSPDQETADEAAAGARLHPTYEAAASAVLTGKADLLVVANAYNGIDAFYMNPAMQLLGAFIHRTPEYGIALPPGRSLPARPRVATHRAPVPLVAQLMPAGFDPEIVIAPSTSAAALAAQSGDVDCALTTKVAAGLYQLRFIGSTRPIDMLWSVFGATARSRRRTAVDQDAAAVPSGSELLDGFCA